MKTVTIYFLYFTQFLKARLAYKADFFASILASALATASGLVFVVALIDGKNIPDLNGWTRDEVLFIYGYSMFSMALFSLLAPNLYNFGDKYVIQGQFDRILLRPLNSLAQVIFESYNLESVGHLIVGTLVFLYTKDHLSIHFGFLDYLWLLVSALSGAAILLGVFIFLSSMSFHFEDRLGIAPPFYNLINFGRYPLPIFNKVIQVILRWIVPFAFVAFYPATHFFNRQGFEFYCYLTPVVAMVCMIVAVVSWNFGVGKYSSTGN